MLVDMLVAMVVSRLLVLGNGGRIGFQGRWSGEKNQSRERRKMFVHLKIEMGRAKTSASTWVTYHSDVEESSFEPSDSSPNALVWTF